MFENEEDLMEELRAQEFHAPEVLQQRLLTAFREHHRARRRKFLYASAPLALAAGLSALVLQTPPVQRIQPAILYPAAPVLTASAPAQAPARRVAVEKRVASKRRAPASPRQEVATGFLPLPNADMLAPIDEAAVVRVEVPRSAMRLMGFPVNQNRGVDSIHADVVFGQDGLARAIRFVQ